MAETPRPQRPARLQPHPGLVAFALAHARITHFMGSCQRTRSNAYRLQERTLPDYNLIYVWEGGAQWTIDGVSHVLGEDDLLIVPPGAAHSGTSTTAHMTLGSIHALARLPGGRDLFELLALPRQRRLAAGSRLDQLFRAAMQEYERPWTVAESMIPAWTELIVKELIRDDAESGRLRTVGCEPVVEAVLRFLAGHLAEPLPLRHIARAAGYSAQHLNRLFQRDLGTTPLGCLLGLRMERAGQLLREGRLTVRGVGQAVGYGDPAYFSRAFRRHHGLSPSAFQGRSQAQADA